jgi:predicted nuclease with TOPRIM domain
MTQKYPQRIEKSEAMYKMWEDGEGDIDELAIGLYNLIAEYKALWDDYAKLKTELVDYKSQYDSLIEETWRWIERLSISRRQTEALIEAKQDALLKEKQE